jgi:membrane protein DedA with SNARE-associated domain
MTEYLTYIIEWYEAHLNYGTITLLMAVESSFVPFPSELVIPPAAYLAVKGQLNLGLIIFFSTVGCILGALFNYALALYLGRGIVYAFAAKSYARLFLITPEKIQYAETFFLENGKMSTLVGRLTPAVRQLISIPAGLARMNLRDFIIYTTLGSAIWNIILALVSYFLIDQWKVYMKEISIGCALFALTFVGWLIYKALKKKA